MRREGGRSQAFRPHSTKSRADFADEVVAIMAHSTKSQRWTDSRLNRHEMLCEPKVQIDEMMSTAHGFAVDERALVGAIDVTAVGARITPARASVERRSPYAGRGGAVGVHFCPLGNV